MKHKIGAGRDRVMTRQVSHSSTSDHIGGSSTDTRSSDPQILLTTGNVILPQLSFSFSPRQRLWHTGQVCAPTLQSAI
jgi:hypothetical protein